MMHAVMSDIRTHNDPTLTRISSRSNFFHMPISCNFSLATNITLTEVPKILSSLSILTISH